MTDRVSKFIQGLDKIMKRRLKQKLLAIKSNPLGIAGVKAMQNWGKNIYRIRVGKIRIIYKILNNDIEVIDIDYRDKVYKK